MSGRTIRTYFLSKDYEDAHLEEGCTGAFEYREIKDGILTLDAIGPVRLPFVPMAVCEKCHAAYEVNGFRAFVEGAIANSLVTSSAKLNKKQIRFLRLFLDMTQGEFAELIGVANRFEISKMESESSERELDADKQKILKIQCMRRLEIKDSEKIYGAIGTLDERSLSNDETIVSESDIRKNFGKAN